MKERLSTNDVGVAHLCVEHIEAMGTPQKRSGSVARNDDDRISAKNYISCRTRQNGQR